MDIETDFSLYSDVNTNHGLGIPHNLLSKKGLNVLYLNGRSIRNKLNDIEIFLQNINQVVHLILITETWLDQNDKDFYNLNNYNSYHNVRDKYGGGVAIFCHESIKSDLLVSEIFLTNSHLLVVKLCDYNINIATVYRAPDCNISDFLSYFASKLNSYKNIIYIGDFNINFLNNQSVNTNEFRNLINSEGHVILNKNTSEYATRKVSNSILDYVITDLIKYSYNLYLEDIDHLSDHRAILLNFETSISVKKFTITKTKINYPKIQTAIETSTQLRFSDTFDEFSSSLANIIKSNKSVKTTDIVVTKYKQSWCNDDLKLLVKKRKVYYDLFKKHPTNVFYHNSYKNINQEISQKIKTDKKTYYDDEFEKNLHNPRHTWGLINNIIYNKPKNNSSTAPKKIVYKDVVNETPIAVSNALNDFFGNIGSDLASDSGSTDDPVFVSNNNTPLSTFKPVTISEIKNIINSLNSSSASGSDDISVKILKMSIDTISPILCKLINQSFNTGVFPDLLKLAKVIPIYKSGKKTDPGNYRPISILSNLSKIYELCIKMRLLEFFSMNKSINENQFGFQKHSNTTSACLTYIEFVMKQIEQKRKTGSIFIDIRKAFDSVDHKILLNKLKNAGLQNKAYDLIQNYFVNRYQFVEYSEGVCSDKFLIKTGVPQGSILGPILFIFFIDDLFNEPLVGQLQLYADDATVTYGAVSFNELKNHMTSDLLTIQKWMIQNRLSINFSKTNFLVFYLRNTDVSELFNDICFDNIKIDRVMETKYLGLLINHNLNWVPHIEAVKKKVSRFVGVLYRISNFVNVDTKMKIYYAFIHSHITYLNTIWGSADCTNLKPLQTMQNRSVKLIYNLPRLTPSVGLYLNSTILPIKYLFRFELSLLVFKISNNLIKFKSSFTINSDNHSYTTRFKNNLKCIFSRNNVTKKSIYNLGVRTFNELPVNIKKELKISVFKNELKSHYKKAFIADKDL